MRHLILLVCLGTVIHVDAQPIDSEWAAFTSMNQITDLIVEGLDPQLETALLLLQSQVIVPPTARAALK